MPKGTVTWEGMPNVLWAINTEKKLGMFFGIQLVPVRDKIANGLALLFMRNAWNKFFFYRPPSTTIPSSQPLLFILITSLCYSCLWYCSSCINSAVAGESTRQSSICHQVKLIDEFRSITYKLTLYYDFDR